MVTAWIKASMAGLLAAGLMVAVGCTQPATPSQAPPKKDDDGGHGWWCDEHGVVEDECSMCSDKVFKKCEAKGDVCPVHKDRAKSQCFICNPELWEKSAARYKEKFSKEPPAPEKNMPPKK